MPTPTPRCGVLAAGGVTAVLLVAAVCPAPAAAVINGPQPAFGGRAYGTTGHLGTVFRSGPSALLPLCTTRIGLTRTNATQGSTRAGVGTLGSVRTRVATRGGGDTFSTVTTAQTGASRLFAGALGASALTATATASHSGSAGALSGTTTLDHLIIGGRSMPTHPAANQKVAIPGIGYAVLNQQTRTHTHGTDQLTVVAAHITVGSGNTLGLPAGAITISAARAALHPAAFRAASGFAYGTQVRSGATIRSGYTAPSFVPCGGTNGDTVGNNSAAVSAAGVHTGSVRTTARSTDEAAATTATTRSELGSVSLLGGAIKAAVITSQATARRAGGTLSRSSTGTTLTGFTINGKTQPADPPVNTKRAVPGLGTVYLHRVVETPTGIRVFAIQLVLARSQHGLPAGSVLTVGASYAAVAGSAIG